MIDTHAHLDHLENLDQALDNARRVHLEGIVALSMDVASCHKNLEIKKTVSTPHIYLGMGIHPSEAKVEDIDACVDLIRTNQKLLHAVGEIGLDFWYKWVRKDDQKKDEQRKVFRALLEIAHELNLPAVVHARGTWKECLETVQSVGIKQAEFHWYSGPLDILKDILDAGYFISAPPALAYSPPLRAAMELAPIEQVLIETDCPVFFKADENDPGFKSEPKDVVRTLKAYVELKNMDEAKAAHILTNNAKRFFGIKE